VASKKEKNAHLAREAFASVFEGSKLHGRVPSILSPPPTQPQERPAAERPPRKTGLHLLLPQGGFTHPENGYYTMIPREFKAILALESKAVAQVVYEIIDQTVGWEDPGGRGGRREWVRLSLRHFMLACAMSLSQAQNGLKTALNKGYIVRRPYMGEYEYAVKWREEREASDHT
jgi:hypothetical protein